MIGGLLEREGLVNDRGLLERGLIKERDSLERGLIEKGGI